VPSDANIVFVESPTAVGYSYSNTSSDYELFTDKSTGTEFLSFLPFTNTSNHSIPFIELHY
jgi:carboxypeptidase C (cathepsin A)